MLHTLLQIAPSVLALLSSRDNPEKRASGHVCTRGATRRTPLTWKKNTDARAGRKDAALRPEEKKEREKKNIKAATPKGQASHGETEREVDGEKETDCSRKAFRRLHSLPPAVMLIFRLVLRQDATRWHKLRAANTLQPAQQKLMITPNHNKHPI